VDLDVVMKGKIVPYRESNPGRPSLSQSVYSYMDSAAE
jgi:hypothetical protein